MLLALSEGRFGVFLCRHGGKGDGTIDPKTGRILDSPSLHLDCVGIWIDCASTGGYFTLFYLTFVAEATRSRKTRQLEYGNHIEATSESGQSSSSPLLWGSMLFPGGCAGVLAYLIDG